MLDVNNLVHQNVLKATQSMNALSSIGVNSGGFPPILASRFYAQMIRSQLDYGLTISPLNKKLLDQLETFQNLCIRRIFGGHSRSSVKTMLHLLHFPSMCTRVATLQAQYLYRSTHLPRDTLMAHLLNYIRSSNSSSHWYRLSKSTMWKQFCAPRPDPIDPKTFTWLRNNFVEDEYKKRFAQPDSLLLSSCRAELCIDPILWLPMSRSERSRAILWRLGWLPGGKPKPCYFHPQINWSRRHAIACLDMHHRLLQPQSIDDPLSFFMTKNRLRSLILVEHC